MEFDKSKILTCVTADQAKVGSMGYFSNYVPTLENYTTGHCKQDKLLRVNLNAIYPFFDGYNYYSLFYPAQEPTYAERQTEWVRKTGLKVGDKVIFTKGFENEEDGSLCCKHPNAKGKTGTISRIGTNYIDVALDGKDNIWCVPYTALELIKEPTYRPFKNAEEFKPYRDEWFVSKCDNSKSSSVNVQNYSNLGVILLREVTKNDDVMFDLCRWDEFFQWFVRENGDPCGVREEA